MSKYIRVVEWIKNNINQGLYKAGDRIPSENTLTEILKVSRQTVRKAIGMLVEEGIIENRRGSGNYVAGGKKEKIERKKYMRIAIVTTYVNEYMFPEMLEVMETQLSSKGYAIQVEYTNNSVEKERIILKELIKRNNVDGIIMEPTKSGLPSPNMNLYKELERKGIKIVFLHSYYPELSNVHVSMDDKKAGYMVTDLLISCGHRKIGAIFKLDDGQGHRRYLGYCEALMKKGIQIRGEWIKWIDSYELDNLLEYSLEIMDRLRDCTACVCYNDAVALKLISMYKNYNMNIPTVLSIVGIDNESKAKLCEVPITTVNNPVLQLAEEVSEAIVVMCEGNKIVRSRELEPTLILRNSVNMIDNFIDK